MRRSLATSEDVPDERRAAPAPSEPAHGALTPAALLALQRTAGNQATGAYIRARAPTVAVQRNEESKRLLVKLAQPQVLPGPEVEIQDEIVAGLEREIEKLGAEEQDAYKITCVGGIEFPRPITGDLQELIKGAELIDLPDRAIGKSSFALADAANVKRQIVINTLSTMNAAGQLEYLRASGLIDKEWKVVVEVHYYRDRDTSQTKFHKDTRGETLFVNLNFVNKQAGIAGPEYIINPASNETYDKFVQNHLPGVFFEDLAAVKEAYGEPQRIGATVIPKNGVVAFVDEAIHHKTPTLAHRTTSAGAVAMALSKTYPEDYAEARKGYEAYKSRMTNWWSFSSFAKGLQPQESEGWLKLMTGIENTTTKFDRTQLTALLPRPDFLDVDALIESGDGDFTQASFLHAKTINVPVKKAGRPPLKRTMSEMKLNNTAPIPVPGRRTFFRTWVRAVRREPK